MLSLRKIPPGALIGLVLTSIFLFAAIFAPLIAPYRLDEIVGDVWEPMTAEHWLGTDNLGRDLLSRMIYGARTTIAIAAIATALSFVLGAVLGFTAAVVGGWFDNVLSRFVDLLMSIPTLIFALVVLSVLPSNIATLILVMGVLDSTRVYRLSRAVAVDINVMDFVEAARLRGEEGAAGSSSARFCPTRSRRWCRNWVFASFSPCCSCRRSLSSGWASSRRQRTGAAW